jgi:hypothetical protein
MRAGPLGLQHQGLHSPERSGSKGFNVRLVPGQGHKQELHPAEPKAPPRHRPLHHPPARPQLLRRLAQSQAPRLHRPAPDLPAKPRPGPLPRAGPGHPKLGFPQLPVLHLPQEQPL